MRVKDNEEYASTGSSTRKIDFPVLIVLLILVAAVLVFLALFSDIDRNTLIAYVIFTAIIFPLGALGAKYKSVEDAIKRTSAALDNAFAWTLFTLVPIVLFNLISQFLIVRVSPWVQGPIFIAWALLLALAVWVIATERNRERVFGTKAKGSKAGASSKLKAPHFTPVLFAFDLLVIAAMFFSSLTFVLVQNGWAELAGASVDYGALLLFYMWHFLEAIPLVKVNDTLQWKAPLTYQSGLVGFLVLLFKISVILPVIAAFAWYWKKITADTEREIEVERIVGDPGVEA